MLRQKYLLCFLVLMAFCVMAGGCGGGSSGGSVEQDNNTPNNPGNPDTPSAEYSISILEGNWTASSGTGTATGYGETFDLRMIHVNASFSNVQVSGSTATAIASTSAEWDIYRNGAYIASHYSDYNREAIEIRHAGTNKWSYSFPDGDTVTVTITSATTADVAEEGYTSDGYRYTASYTVTKDDANTPVTYDISALQGMWRPSSGGGTAIGNGGSYELRLSSGGSLYISNMQVNGDTLSGNMAGTIYWNVYQNSTRIMTAGLEYSTLEMQHVSGNTWRTSDGNNTMTLTSQATASVHEKGTFWAYGYNYQYDIVYDIAKQ